MKKEAATLMALRFAEIYSKTGNATRSAKEAGYSEKTAYSQGSRLLKRGDVQEYLRAARLDRTVLAQQTFNEIVEVKDKALKFLADMEASGDSEDRARAFAVTFKYQELLSRCCGLLVEQPPPPADRDAILKSLQELVKALPKYAPLKIIDAPLALEAPKNGNGWHSIEEKPNGNGEAH